MCGIFGVLALSASSRLDAVWLSRMGRAMLHRGPDGAGSYTDDAILLGMQRLSIIDVAEGKQPIANEDASVQAVCNGEIFNFRELRRDLLARGHSMRSRTDSEVLVHLYEEYPDTFCERLDGMFGFALWDRARRRLVLGRDRLGVKPLYYWQDARYFAFASEVKSLLQLPFIQPQLDKAALRDLLTFGYVSGADSVFAGVRRLEPGRVLTVTPSGQTLTRYWRLPPGTNETMTEDDWVDAVREKMTAAVQAQMVSDVPIGAFLSGGLDSSSIVALMAKQGGDPIRTFAIGFDNSSGARIYDERAYARQMAEHIGAQHSEIIVSPDVVGLLPQLIWHLDEPIADSALFTTYLVARHAQGHVKVILSGVGGDEVFGGYPRYLGEHYRRAYNRVPRWLRVGLVARLANLLPGDRHSLTRNYMRYLKRFIHANESDLHHRYRGYSRIFDDQQLAELGIPEPLGPDALARAFEEARGEEPLRQLLGVDLATQLPDDLLLLTDKMTMAASIECRVPLLDVGLVELMATMPERIKMRGGKLKYLMKRAMADLLPPEIISRRKRGFGAPIGAWFRDELASLTTAVLSKRVVEKRGLLNWRGIESMLALHQSGREDSTDHIMTLITLELWCRIFLDGRPVSDVAEELSRHTSPGKGRAAAGRPAGRAADVRIG
jgi:asparagine synthase (glutamine-hydrolysing)